jgi:hypothetical protein
MIAVHDDVSLWTKQGLEKLNDIMSKDYFKSTKKNEDFLERMVHRKNGMEVMHSIQIPKNYLI